MSLYYVILNNLLVSLEALLTQRNVTRAAARVGLSQPAMSNALARLRALFRDRLLIRNGRTMVLSAKGQQLLLPVRAAVRQAQEVFGDETQFTPASCRQTFCLATTDYWEFLFLTHLMHLLELEAPGVSIEVKRLGGGQFEPPLAELRSGSFDLAVGFFPEVAATSSDIYLHQLCADRLVSITRTGNRRARKKLTLSNYLELGHVATKYRETGGTFTVDSALELIGRSRIRKVTVPHHFIVPYVVAQSDYVGNLPEKMAKKFCGMLPLRLCAAPIKSRPMNTVMLWHERTHSDPAQSWFRSMLVRCSRQS